MYNRRTRHFYADEAGDLTFFNKKGRNLLGTEGVSNYFMIGMLQLEDPYAVHQELEALRQYLKEEPYFAGVPSMQTSANKTSLAFHAKDDSAEVRYEVIKIIREFECSAIIAVRRKDSLIQQRRSIFETTGQRVPDNAVYDQLVTDVFERRLHPGYDNKVVFARRGVRDRAKALEKAIMVAGVHRNKNIRPTIPGSVESAFPHEHAGLQVVDYYLWAVQRLFEKGDSRPYRNLEPNYELIMDIDDKRRNTRGEWYSPDNELTAGKIKPFAS